MTVTYSNDLSTAKFGTLFKLLRRWRGSVWKLLWKDLLLYLTLFYIIHISYMFLNDANKKDFENAAAYFKAFKSGLPLAFVLGFFVTIVTGRWWDQYMNIPWPYGIAVYVSSTIHGYDEVGRAMRRTIMRYVCLSLTMVFRVLSRRVRERFPRMSDLIDAGLLNQSELNIIEDLEAKFPGYGKNWLPIVWAASLVNRARAEGRIKDDMAVKTLIEEMNKFRGSCGNLMIYNSINIPLVYLHVVTVAVYTNFLIALVADQFYSLNLQSRGPEKLKLDHIPLLLIVQFIIYMGWLKVAETMINPFGDDDDDFEVSYMIDRNIQMSYLIVDEMHEVHPELLKDQYWNMIPKRLPDRKPNDEGRDQQKEPKDVESVIPKTRSNLLPSNIKLKKDIEAPNKPSNQTLPPSKTDLVPRQYVIDERFKDIPDVDVKQSNLLRMMEVTQKKNISGERFPDVPTTCSSSDEEDGVNDPVLGKKRFRSSTIQEFNRETQKERKRSFYELVEKNNLSFVRSDAEVKTEQEPEKGLREQDIEDELKDGKGNQSRRVQELKNREKARRSESIDVARGSETFGEAHGSKSREEARGSKTSGEARGSKSRDDARGLNPRKEGRGSKSREEARGSTDQNEFKVNKSPKVSFSNNTNLDKNQSQPRL